MIKLKQILIKENDNCDWDYLLSEPFTARNHLAAAWCKDSKNVLEVGSYKNPLYNFYTGQNVKLFTLVDPKAKSFEKTQKIGSNTIKISSHGEKLEDVKIPNHDTIVCLGLDIPSRESFSILKEHCKNASTIILEGTISWPKTVRQINEIIELRSHKIVVDVKIDYTNSNVKTLNTSHPVYNERRFIVLRND